MKDHAEYRTDEEIKQMLDNFDFDSEYDEQSKERDAYFTDPANAEEISTMFARMEMITAMYNARKEAGLTQSELAKRMGTKQTYIAALERGRKNITLTTLAKYAAACGKRVALSLL